MKLLITGGGTGGHIYPALAIAHRMKKEYPKVQILYVGTEHGMEAELVPNEGLDFKAIRVKGFRRKLSLDTVKSAKELILGLNDARKVIKDFSPDIVIGTGGYVCGPIVLLAALKNIPTMIHEQNALPGVTNRILSRFVDKIAGSFEESIKYFKNEEKVVITGNPIREDFINVDRKKAREKFNVENNNLILSFGGSGGQKSLNRAIIDVIEKNLGNNKLQIMHVTGKRFFENFMKELKDKGIEKTDDNIKIIPYLFDMAEGLAAADIVITSAGAITIAEVTAIGVPTILIPKSYTAENHQEFNARALEKKGVSKLILEKDLNGDKLNNLISEILVDKAKLLKMSRESKKIGRIDSVDKILEIINSLIKR